MKTFSEFVNSFDPEFLESFDKDEKPAKKDKKEKKEEKGEKKGKKLPLKESQLMDNPHNYEDYTLQGVPNTPQNRQAFKNLLKQKEEISNSINGNRMKGGGVGNLEYDNLQRQWSQIQNQIEKFGATPNDYGPKYIK